METVVGATLIALLASLTPGPDIFLTVLHSMRFGWRLAAFTVAGIVVGVSLHLAVGISGVSLLLARSGTAMVALSILGGSWLVTIGLQGVRSLYRNRSQRQATSDAIDAQSESDPLPSPAPGQLFLCGLMTNLLNPKALLFFISLFAIVLGPETPLHQKLLTAVSIPVCQATAFISVAYLIDKSGSRSRWKLIQARAEWVLSLLLIFLGGALILRTLVG